jgi:hypothetical protein
MIFMMVDANGRSGGSSDIMSVGASDDNTCLNSLSPSSTSGIPTSSASSPSSATTSSGASPATSSNSGGGISIAAIAGSVIGALIFLAAVITLGLFFFRRKRDKWDDGSSTIKRPRRAQSGIDLTYDPGYVPNTHPYIYGSATSTVLSTPFPNSSPYLDEPPHPQYPAQYQLPSQYSQNPAPSHYQSQTYSTPHTDSFNQYTSSEAQSTIVQPFVDPPTIHNSKSAARQKAPSAGASAVTPSRFIVHTDVEDDPLLNERETVELPPQYSDRRGPLLHHGPSDAQQMQLPPGSLASPLSKS